MAKVPVTARRQNLVQSSPPSFLTEKSSELNCNKFSDLLKGKVWSNPGAVYPVHFILWFQAPSKEKDWTKFWGTTCPANFGPILPVVISSRCPKITLYDKNSDNSSPARFGSIFGMCIRPSLAPGHEQSQFEF